MSGATLCGLETEYGGVIRGADVPDPVRAARLLLSQCDEAGPLLSQLNEEESLMLPNGARFYIDHGHPEYSTPEVRGARDLVAADKAGELLLDRAAQRVQTRNLLSAQQFISVYKNNTDYQGHSYGCHENYLVSPSLFERLSTEAGDPAQGLTERTLLPFLISRSIYCGAGKIGADNGSAPCGYQLTQRADFFESVRGLQTTYCRPLFNTRDEPHSACYRRLHVIVGDANMSEHASFLKVGTTQLLLQLLERGKALPDLSLADPVMAWQLVSRDLSLRQPLTLRSGQRATALELQCELLGHVSAGLAADPVNPEQQEILHGWSAALAGLERGGSQARSRFDWAIKGGLLGRYLAQAGSSWDEAQIWQPIIEALLPLRLPPSSDDEALSAALAAVAPAVFERARRQRLELRDYERQQELFFGLRRLDLEYHDIHRGSPLREAGLFYRMQARGLVDRLLSDAEIEQRIAEPPRDTRAFLRGRCLLRHGRRVLAADWSWILLRQPDGQLRRIDWPDPLAGADTPHEDAAEVSPELSTA